MNDINLEGLPFGCEDVGNPDPTGERNCTYVRGPKRGIAFPAEQFFGMLEQINRNTLIITDDTIRWLSEMMQMGQTVEMHDAGYNIDWEDPALKMQQKILEKQVESDKGLLLALMAEGPLTTEAGIVLSDDQVEAVKTIICSKDHCFMTGAAGTGKSVVSTFLEQNFGVVLTATTGRAALNIKGCTIDSLCCFKRTDYRVASWKRLDRNMMGCGRRILLDEASQAGEQMINMLYYICALFGRQLILVGDFAQAAPVQDMFPFETVMYSGINVIKLTQIHRQSEELTLEVLNKLRKGVIDEQVEEAMISRIVPEVPEDNDDGTLIMFGTNKKTEAYNIEQLNKHVEISEDPVTKFVVEARFIDRRDPEIQKRYPAEKWKVDKALEDCNLAHNEEFAVGARIMLTANEPTGQFVNGDIGIIVAVLDNSMTEIEPDIMHQVQSKDISAIRVVIYDELGKLSRSAKIHRITREAEDASGNVTHQLVGFPIRLGYAMTIYKSQGVTAHRIWVDVSSIRRHRADSRHGLFYVAVSRSRTLDGIQISEWDDAAVYCSPLTHAWI